ncbi:solute carrier family 2, facilitated glucose transporter member 12-like isoform X2 [Lineus longissimus]|uniref:solute carrier family 2, facilitated glucose transporter member 12-like isoform X2 n=1 Tax=Lineus longissimus TaxID=88925 RepID=UPI002B4E2F52
MSSASEEDETDIEIYFSDSAELLNNEQRPAIYSENANEGGRATIELDQKSPDSLETLPRPWPEQQKTTKYVVGASVMAAAGGILFGYDIGIISGALLQLTPRFHLSCLEQSMVVGSMLFGAVIGSLCGGFIIDKWGRRLALVFNSGMFVIGAIILAAAPTYYVLVFGRLVVGFAVSLSAIGECIYISEIAPARRRGLLVSLNELGITVGLLLAYLVNFLFITMENGWRYMFGISMLPAVVQGVGMFFLPPSPRFLMIKKKEEEAEKVLKLLRGTPHVESELHNIKIAIQIETDHKFCDLFSSVENMRGRMFIGAGCVFLQQVTGQPNVLYFAPTIFQSVGFKSDSAATLVTVGLGFIKVLSTVLALLCVDRAGRRRFLIVGASMMGVSILILGVVIMAMNTAPPVGVYCTDNNKKSVQFSSLTHANILPNVQKRDLDPNPNLFDFYSNESSSTPWSNSSVKTTEASFNTTMSPNTTSSGLDDAPLISKWISFGALMVFVSAYAFSFGPVVWLLLSEIFPASIRGRAISMATVLNWATNLLVSFTFLDLMDVMGVSWTFILYSGICAIAVVFIFSFVPETKNRSLEQISSDLSQGSFIQRVKKNFKSTFRRKSTLKLRVTTSYERFGESLTMDLSEVDENHMA